MDSVLWLLAITGAVLASGLLMLLVARLVLEVLLWRAGRRYAARRAVVALQQAAALRRIEAVTETARRELFDAARDSRGPTRGA